jgi:gas vesicle protein
VPGTQWSQKCYNKIITFCFSLPGEFNHIGRFGRIGNLDRRLKIAVDSDGVRQRLSVQGGFFMDFLKNAKEKIDEAKDKLKDKVEDIKEKVDEEMDESKDKLKDLKEKAGDQMDEVKDKAKDAVVKIKDKFDGDDENVDPAKKE